MIASSLNSFAMPSKGLIAAVVLIALAHSADAGASAPEFEMSGAFEQVGACVCFEFSPGAVCSAPKFALNLIADSIANKGRSWSGRGAEDVLAADGSIQTVGHWLYPYPGQTSSSIWNEFRKRDTDLVEYRFSKPSSRELRIEVKNKTLLEPSLPLQLVFKPSQSGGEINGRERREFLQSSTDLEYRVYRRQRDQATSDPATKNYSAFSDGFKISALGPDRIRLVAEFDFTMDSFGHGPRFSFNSGYVACELQRH